MSIRGLRFGLVVTVLVSFIRFSISTIPTYTCGDGHCACTTTSANCKGKNLTFIPRIDACISSLDISRNVFTALSHASFVNVTTRNIIMLKIRDCKIKHLAADTFEGFTNLTKLSLPSKPDIESYAFNNSHLRELYLTNSHLSFDTQVHEDALRGINLHILHIASITEHAIPRNIREQLSNINLADNPFTCDCNLRWFIDWVQRNSSIFKQYPKRYLRWRIRHLIYMKYYRPKRQRNPANIQDYTFDAYVILSDEDEDWVVDEMIPKLEEQHQLKLCIPNRDFCSGYILDNIDSAIQTSRHIIVVLSPSFADSDWCQASLMMAQTFVLDTRANPLITVLLGEPDARNLSHSLHKLLRDTAHITWGEEDDARETFWGRLVAVLKINENQCACVP
ncbi:toll-like receptor 4 [Haliotis cracherodii]|uniref:toll-like receptor 4 n=1 Tax=Haliotis cracherodii TaxID=6455 RepID=UPI0039E7D123